MISRPARCGRVRTQLIHGRFRSKKWDYNHHVVPPMSASATFRLEGAQRGAAGFFNFACDRVNPDREVPIYIYDRLDEPTRGMLEENLATAEAPTAASPSPPAWPPSAPRWGSSAKWVTRSSPTASSTAAPTR